MVVSPEAEASNLPLGDIVIVYWLIREKMKEDEQREACWRISLAPKLPDTFRTSGQVIDESPDKMNQDDH